MTNSAEEPTVLPGAHDADRFEQQLPVSPDEAGEADEDAGTETGPALPEGSEADRMEQRLPETPRAGGGMPRSGQPVEEGSEADRIEQATGIFGADDDDYPHGAAD
jgi:hypothetical protein